MAEVFLGGFLVFFGVLLGWGLARNKFDENNDL